MTTTKNDEIISLDTIINSPVNFPYSKLKEQLSLHNNSRNKNKYRILIEKNLCDIGTRIYEKNSEAQIKEEFKNLVLVSHIYSELDINSPCFDELKKMNFASFNNILQKNTNQIYVGYNIINDNIELEYQSLDDVFNNLENYKKNYDKVRKKYDEGYVGNKNNNNKNYSFLKYIQIPLTIVAIEYFAHPISSLVNYLFN